MKKFVLFVVLMLVFSITAGTVRASDTLTEIKRKGVMVVGVRDALPPFGYFNNEGQLVGYDLDYAKAIARELKVKLKFVAVSADSRIPRLVNGDVDIIVACLSKTAERDKLVDFSLTYFVNGQRFIARKGLFKYPRDFAGKTVGLAKGTTAGEVLAREIPSAVQRQYDDYSAALTALRKGEVDAVSTDEVILKGLYLEMPDKERFEIPPAQISGETMGIAVREGDAPILAAINKILMKLEKSGEADRIYATWFGPGTSFERVKNFNRGMR